MRPQHESGSPSIQRLFTHLFAVPLQAIIREGEDGQGDGEVMQRAAASQQLTRWLHRGESTRFTSPHDTGCPFSTVVTIFGRWKR
jgi:hypothetical protein